MSIFANVIGLKESVSVYEQDHKSIHLPVHFLATPKKENKKNTLHVGCDDPIFGSAGKSNIQCSIFSIYNSITQLSI